MKTRDRILIASLLTFALSLAGTAALGAPGVLNNMLRLHVIADASLPSTGSETKGGMMFGLTTGKPLWSPGDGGSWQRFGEGWSSDGTTTTTTQNINATTGTTILNGAATFFDSSSNGWRPYTTGAGGDFILYTPSGAGAFALQATYAFRANAPYGFITAGGFESTVGSGSTAFQISTNGAKADFGAGANDHATSDGTTVTFAGPLGSAGNINTAGVFTRAGVEIAQPTITSATSIASVLTANFELGGIRFQTPTTFTRFGQTTLVTGVGAGNLVIEVYNNTAAAVVCTRTLACTLALGMSSASCSGTAAAGEDLVLRIDASACTTSPVMALTAMYR